MEALERELQETNNKA
jgi:cell division protein FtsI/penicillin-binding protein 2